MSSPARRSWVTDCTSRSLNIQVPEKMTSGFSKILKTGLEA